MAKAAQPLNLQMPIVDPATGAPTEYFIRWAQQFSGGAATEAELQELQDEINNLGLDNLTDVDVSTDPPSNNQALSYDSGVGLWVPKTVSGGGGWVPTPPVISDFTVMRKYSAIGTPTLTEPLRGTGVLFTAPRNSGSGWEQSYIFKPAPAGTQWRVEAFINLYQQSNNNYFLNGIGCGSSLVETVNISLCSYLNGVSDSRHGNLRGYPSLNANSTMPRTPIEQIIVNEDYAIPIWYALEYDAPTITAMMSLDGYSWSVTESADADAYVGGPMDLIGFSHMSVSSASGSDYTRCTHWKETTNLSDPIGLNT